MNKKFLSVLFSMSFLLLFGKALGFIRTAMVASTYGAGFVSDIYSFEDSLINEIYAIFSTFLACSFIPKYLSLEAHKRNRLFNLLLNCGIAIMALLTVFCLVFTKSLLRLLVPGYFELYDISQIIFITRINLIMLILTFLVNYIMIVLQTYEIFIYLSLESVILNVVVIGYLLAMPNAGILGLLSCRIVAYLILLILVTTKLKRSTPLKYKLYLNPRDKDFVDMVRLSLPMLCITVLWQLNYVIDKSMASELKSGSVACLNYANVISMIIYNVIGYIVSTYAYPIMSKIQSDEYKISNTFREYFLILLKLVLPISILTMFFAEYASNLLYGHGNMSAGSIITIANILIMYLPGSIAYCIKNLYSKLFYIKKNTKIVLGLDIAGCMANIILNFILVNFMGVYGLALATSISYCVTVVLQIIFANKKGYTNLELNDLRHTIVYVIALSAIGFVTSYALKQFINDETIKFIYVSMVYLIVCGLFGFKDLKQVVNT